MVGLHCSRDGSIAPQVTPYIWEFTVERSGPYGACFGQFFRDLFFDSDLDLDLFILYSNVIEIAGPPVHARYGELLLGLQIKCIGSRGICFAQLPACCWRKKPLERVKGSTINRDLRFLAQILKQAERERCLARSPFDRTKFFPNESRDRRKPHILTWEEQEKLLAVASPRLRVLVVLAVETGMRTGEMLKLQWKDIDFLNDVLQVGRSKSNAGIRAVPISAQCQTELLRWRNLIGPEFSEWVFPNFANRRHPLQKGGRKAWANALKKAELPFFPISVLSRG